jgi:hypothetical protein
LRRAEIQESGVRDWALDDKTPVLGGVIGTTNLVSVEINLTAGQFVELKVQQDTGGPLDVEGGVRYSPNFSIRKVAS